MELDGMKEVYFDQYCKTCRHAKKKEDEEFTGLPLIHFCEFLLQTLTVWLESVG